MNKSSLIRWGSGLAVAAVLFGATVLAPPRAVAQDEPLTLEQQLGGKLGVVDYDSLLKAHPNYSRLEQFDQQLALLEQQREFLPMKEREGKINSAKERMRTELEKARQQMEAEQARIQAELAGISEALAGKLRAEFEGEQAAMKAELEKFIAQHKPSEASLPDTVASKDDYIRNLEILRQREIAAQRIELEKQRSDSIAAERARIDSELAAYEDEIMRRNQQEKLNIQLAIQVAKDETEQAALEEKLNAISDEEARLKNAKRDELEAQFKAFKSGEESRSQAELQARTGKVQAEFDRKVREKLAQGGDVSAPRPNMPDLTPEVKAKIQQKQRELEARLQARQAEMKAQMEAESAAAVARLQVKQKEIEARLQQVQAEIKKTMADTSDMSPATKKELSELDEQIKALKAQREELYNLMVSDLKGEIEKVAQKEGVDMVVGLYVHNEKCVDLTDRSMVAVKQMEAR